MATWLLPALSWRCTCYSSGDGSATMLPPSSRFRVVDVSNNTLFCFPMDSMSLHAAGAANSRIVPTGPRTGCGPAYVVANHWLCVVSLSP